MSTHDESTGSARTAEGTDNVIYANFGTRKRVSAPEEVLKVDRTGLPADGGKVARINRGAGASRLPAAATRLVSFVSRNTDDGRLKRGRDYARKGHVVSLDVRNGAIHGKVAGSQNEPFAVLIQLPYRSVDDVAEITSVLARTPNALRDARLGTVPEEIIDTILGADASDVRFSCTCPDNAYACKHVVAVVEQLAARMDADPSVLFAMRGLDFAQLEKALVETHQAAAADAHDGAGAASPLSPEERYSLFWEGRPLPDVPRPKVAPALEDSDMDLLRKALRSVSLTNIELLRAVSDVEELYEHLTR